MASRDNGHGDCGSPLLNAALLIPARNPGAQLIHLVEECVRGGFSSVVVVDDGSEPECGSIFDRLAKHARVRVLRHGANRGKGRALKTGMQFFLSESATYGGIVTADADGQHTAEDVLRIARAFTAAPHAMIIGARHFDRGVPLRSRLGNVVTRNIFRFVTCRKLTDSQSGLRAIPTAMVPQLLLLPGERYEFETAVLLHACRLPNQPIEMPIRTVYEDGNRTSHFRPLLDSTRIYLVVLRYWLSSLFGRQQPSTVVMCSD
jgi:glycosyltransferase involved in cell wall biosynthesis